MLTKKLNELYNVFNARDFIKTFFICAKNKYGNNDIFLIL